MEKIMKNDYISSVTEGIENPKAVSEIEQELSSHIEEKTDFYIEIGYSEEQALDMAVEEMGNPKEVSKQLNEIHPVTISKKHDVILNLLALIIPFLSIYICLSDSVAVGIPRYDPLSIINFFTPFYLLILNLCITKAKDEPLPILRIINCGIIELISYIISLVYFETIFKDYYGEYPDFIFRERSFNNFFISSFVIVATGLFVQQIIVWYQNKKCKDINKIIGALIKILSVAGVTVLMFCLQDQIISFGAEKICNDNVSQIMKIANETVGDYSKCPDNLKEIVPKDIYSILTEFDKEYDKEIKNIKREYSLSHPITKVRGDLAYCMVQCDYMEYSPKGEVLAGGISPYIITLKNIADRWIITDYYVAP